MMYQGSKCSYEYANPECNKNEIISSLSINENNSTLARSTLSRLVMKRLLSKGEVQQSEPHEMR